MVNKSTNPWTEPTNDNWLKYEIEIVNNRDDLGHLIPHKAIKWLCDHKQDVRLIDALKELAPMYPLKSFNGDTSIWLSPPPSGAGNNIVVIVGRDNRRIRMVGCNFCGTSLTQSGGNQNQDFWKEFDSCKGDIDKYSLMSGFLAEHLDGASLSQARDVDEQCFNYKTMPLYIVCIDTDEVHIWSMPCLIWPLVNPSNLKLEILREF